MVLRRREFLQGGVAAAGMLSLVSGVGTALQPGQTAETRGRHTSQQSSTGRCIVRDGQPKAAIVVTAQAGEDDHFIAGELQRYVHAMTGTKVPIRTDLPSSESSLESVIMIDQKVGSLSPSGFEVRTTDSRDRRTVLLGGNGARGAMYAAYDFLESLGITFRSMDDIVPFVGPDLVCPKLEKRREPAFAYRGLNFWGNHHASTGHWALRDFCKVIDQMAKLKFNQILWHWFSWEPALNYEFRGERNLIGDLAPPESGYAFRRAVVKSFSTRDIEIGRERFNHDWFAPPELQGRLSPEEAFRITVEKWRGVMAYGKRRHIDVIFGYEIQNFPPNIGRHLKRLKPLPFMSHHGTFVCPTDSATQEANEARFRAFLELYPKATTLCLWMSEVPSSCTCDNCKALQEKYLKLFEGIEETSKRTWVHRYSQRTGTNVIHADIGFIHQFMHILELRNRLRPDLKLLIGGIVREYLFPYLDKVLPPDVTFASLTSGVLAGPHGLPIELFRNNTGRDEWIVGRHDDDANIGQLQFNVGTMHKDRVFEGGKEYGVTGEVFQVTRLRGNEHNCRYLAECCWEPTITPTEFYESYSKRVFGPDVVSPIVEAYRLLDENEQYLLLEGAGHGRLVFPGPGLPPELSIMQLFRYEPNPFDGPKQLVGNQALGTSPEKILETWNKLLERCREHTTMLPQAIDRLTRATQSLASARQKTEGKAADELRYLVNKTEAWISLLRVILALDRAYLVFDSAFERRNSLASREFVFELAKAQQLVSEARDLSRHTARLWSEYPAAPEDLGALFSINKRLVAGVTQVEQFFKNLVNFHSGRPYLGQIDWESLFPRMVG